VEENDHRPILKYFGLGVEFAGGLRWYGKRVRLEIYRGRTRNAWYAPIPEEVGVETTKKGNRSKHIVQGENRSVQAECPKWD